MLAPDGDPDVPINLVHEGGLALRGILSFDPSFHMGGYFRCGTLCLSPRIHVEADASLTVAAQVEASLSGSHSFELGEYRFGCICFSIGPVPISIFPKVEVSVDVSASRHAHPSQFQQRRSRWRGVSWDSRHGFGSHSSSDASVGGSAEVGSSTSGTVKLVLKPQLCFYRDSVRRPGYRRRRQRHAQLSREPTGPSVLQAVPGDRHRRQFSADLIFWEPGFSVDLAGGDLTCLTVNNPPGVVLTITPPKFERQPAGTRSFTATRSDGVSRPINWSVTGGASDELITPEGVLNFFGPGGGRQMTVRATDDTGLSATTTVTVGSSTPFDPPTNVTPTARRRR